MVCRRGVKCAAVVSSVPSWCGAAVVVCRRGGVPSWCGAVVVGKSSGGARPLWDAPAFPVKVCPFYAL